MSMHETHRRIASEIQACAARTEKRCILVAIAGPPGCGKTTIAAEVVRLLNHSGAGSGMAEHHNEPRGANMAEMPEHAVCVAMDGFHLPRSTLDKLPNKDEAYVRRGAPWTFDADAAILFVRRLKDWADRNQQEVPIENQNMYAPSFDHTVKDPIENGVCIPGSASIIILEGIYLLLDEPVWKEAGALMDFRVFVDVDENVARARVAKRHVEAGIEQNMVDAFARVDGNDLLNGRLIREKLVFNVDLRVDSLDENRQ